MSQLQYPSRRWAQPAPAGDVSPLIADQGLITRQIRRRSWSLSHTMQGTIRGTVDLPEYTYYLAEKNCRGNLLELINFVLVLLSCLASTVPSLPQSLRSGPAMVDDTRHNSALLPQMLLSKRHLRKQTFEPHPRVPSRMDFDKRTHDLTRSQDPTSNQGDTPARLWSRNQPKGGT